MTNKSLNNIDWFTVFIVVLVFTPIALVFSLAYDHTKKEKFVLENTVDPKVSVTKTSRFNIYEFTLSDGTKCVALSTNSISCNWKNYGDLYVNKENY